MNATPPRAVGSSNNDLEELVFFLIGLWLFVQFFGVVLSVAGDLFGLVVGGLMMLFS